ncbi:MAG: pyruvate formate lyase-activating protein [Clostridia bacterium]|nr:pyruvate formate lyase-activating protein [Clostridia bacterium]
MKGYVHSFESLAAVDGLGIRCAVFLSGCPLRCAYCHNPDTWNRGGVETEPELLVKKIARYKPYFKADGGVTFSGGEPLCQAEFIRECALLLENAGINYAIDTSGAVALDENVKAVLENAQMVILDLKFADNESYEKYTGVGIKRTLETLNHLESIGKDTWIRTVVVPGINDSEAEIQRYTELIKGFSCVKRYELLGFHTMGFFKYEKLGVENPFKGKQALEDDVLKRLQEFADNKLNI